MKKTFMLLLALAMTVSLAACQDQNSDVDDVESLAASTITDADSGNTSQSTDTPDSTRDQSADGSNSNILIAYFGVQETDGVDTVASASRVATQDGAVGNTQFIAQAIEQAVGGDLFAIETVQDYPGTHDALLDFAYNELRTNARPELSGEIENLDDYNIIFLGYPNWNSELPMPLYTFLESNDFAGKTIIPFVTHGGSGFSGTISTISALQPQATVIEDGLSTSRNSVASAAQSTADWAANTLN